MSNTFNVIIGTREITVKPQHGEHFKEGKVIGTFGLTEQGNDQGEIYFNGNEWTHDEQGDLSYVELDTIAEEIINYYK